MKKIILGLVVMSSVSAFAGECRVKGVDPTSEIAQSLIQKNCLITLDENYTHVVTTKLWPAYNEQFQIGYGYDITLQNLNGDILAASSETNTAILGPFFNPAGFIPSENRINKAYLKSVRAFKKALKNISLE